jgi:hypothetical protein
LEYFGAIVWASSLAKLKKSSIPIKHLIITIYRVSNSVAK